jgi:hypothetical protein
MNGLDHSISKTQINQIIETYSRRGKKINASNPQMMERVYNYVINQQNKDSTPGFPYNQFYPTTENFIQNNPKILHDMVFQRLSLLLADDIRGLNAEELVSRGYCDPIKVFIKNEAHRQSKIDEGRCRNIFAVSIVDRIIQQMCCIFQNKYEIANWSSLPSKPGMGFAPHQVDQFVQGLKNYPHCVPSDFRATDVKSWDWNVTEDDLSFEAYVRWRLEGSLPENLNLYRGIFYCMSRKVLVLSDGRALAQVQPGIMPSGAYFTSSSNSRIRVKLGLQMGASVDDMVCMGDDSIEFCSSREIDLVKSDRVFKGIQQFTDSVEFCSHRIYFGHGETYAEPLNVKKMLFQLYSSVNQPAGAFFEKLEGVRVALAGRRDLVEILTPLAHLPAVERLLSF